MKKYKAKINWRRCFRNWGAIIGLVGGSLGICGGGLSLFDRFVPPGVEVIAAIPVCTISKTPTSIKRGISVIVHLRAGNRPVFISGIDYEGEVSLSHNEFLPYAIGPSRTRSFDEINKEFESKLPYYRVSWSGWISDSLVPIKISPHEDRLVRFTFLEMTDLAGIRSGSEYIGFDSDMHKQSPSYTQTHPTLYHIFKHSLRTGGPVDIRDELKNGRANLQLRVGARNVSVHTKKIKKFKIISKNNWEKEPVQKLFYDNY